MGSILMVFIDGLGLGPDNPATNPLSGGMSPCIWSLMRQVAVPLDATLGVPGLPQSATGQASLLTGINAASLIGRHVEGFPGPVLRNLIERHSILGRLSRRGMPCTFANAYFLEPGYDIRAIRPRSCTTVAAISAFGDVRRKLEMERNEAVYQDITRELLRTRGYNGPLVSPGEAAGHLAAIAKDNAFTLFEYFQTDRAGHSNESGFISRVLGTLDRFIEELVNLATAKDFVLMLTSDHGNIEDTTTRSHTLNPVPFILVNAPTGATPEPADLTGVVPCILRMLSPGNPAGL
jgi:hypothetical protein